MRKVRDFIVNHAALLSVVICFFAVHLIANNQYGFHRDELQFISDSRHLSWGFVTYPPFTPFVAFVSRILFGESLFSYRILSSLVFSLILLISGLIARDIGGNRVASVCSALACAASPVLRFSGSVLMYMIFDYFWWALSALFLIRVIKGDPQYWIGVSIAMSMGMMTKYSILFFAICVFVSILLVPERKLFLNRYFPIAAIIALFMILPNALWQISNNFISYDFLSHIHARDMAWGRTDGFFSDQISDCMGYAIFPLVLAGAWFLLFNNEMKRFRAVVIWTAAVLLLFALMKGRGYYCGALYIPLVAAGSVFLERQATRFHSRGMYHSAICAFLFVNAVVTSALVLPLAPAGSDWFRVVLSLNDTYAEQFGWEELAKDVAHIRDSMPEHERQSCGIMAGNYGEAGALEYYGRRYQLPKIMCGTNAFYDRGYDEREVSTVIAVGFDKKFLDRFFDSCEPAGITRNALNLANEETRYHKDIYVCRGPKFRWAEFWKRHRSFG